MSRSSITSSSFRKPKPDIVTDSKGRQRFHGAFTGGFTAGHYNSVGSEGGQGFQVGSYFSSRSCRAEPVKSELVQFVDSDDDWLGSSIKLREKFNTFDRHTADSTSFASRDNHSSSSSDSMQASSLSGGCLLAGSRLLSDLVVLPSRSVGKDLLRRMGWRERQHNSGIHLDSRSTLALKPAAIEGIDTSAYALNSDSFEKQNRYGIAYSGHSSDRSHGDRITNLFSSKIPFGHESQDSDRSKKMCRVSATYSENEDELDYHQESKMTNNYSRFEVEGDFETNSLKVLKNNILGEDIGRTDVIDTISCNVSRWVSDENDIPDAAKSDLPKASSIDGRPILTGFSFSSLTLPRDAPDEKSNCSNFDESQLLFPGIHSFSGHHSFDSFVSPLQSTTSCTQLTKANENPLLTAKIELDRQKLVKALAVAKNVLSKSAANENNITSHQFEGRGSVIPERFENFAEALKKKFVLATTSDIIADASISTYKSDVSIQSFSASEKCVNNHLGKSRSKISKGQSSREVTDWHPSAILCKRLNVLKPCHSSTSSSYADYTNSDNNRSRPLESKNYSELPSTNFVDCFVKEIKPNIESFKHIFVYDENIASLDNNSGNEQSLNVPGILPIKVDSTTANESMDDYESYNNNKASLSDRHQILFRKNTCQIDSNNKVSKQSMTSSLFRNLSTNNINAKNYSSNRIKALRNSSLNTGDDLGSLDKIINNCNSGVEKDEFADILHDLKSNPHYRRNFGNLEIISEGNNISLPSKTSALFIDNLIDNGHEDINRDHDFRNGTSNIDGIVKAGSHFMECSQSIPFIQNTTQSNKSISYKEPNPLSNNCPTASVDNSVFLQLRKSGITFSNTLDLLKKCDYESDKLSDNREADKMVKGNGKHVLKSKKDKKKKKKK